MSCVLSHYVPSLTLPSCGILRMILQGRQTEVTTKFSSWFIALATQYFSCLKPNGCTKTSLEGRICPDSSNLTSPQQSYFKSFQLFPRITRAISEKIHSVSHLLFAVGCYFCCLVTCACPMVHFIALCVVQCSVLRILRFYLQYNSFYSLLIKQGK